ncbi:MAG: Crp/Fnr family transcriptional regulator [Salibacteraceae bacterium]
MLSNNRYALSTKLPIDNKEFLQQFEFKPSEDFLKTLGEFGIQKEFEAGDLILNDDSPIRSIPIILSGSVKVFKPDEEGREILLYYLKAGESCIMSVLGGLFNTKSKVKVQVESDAKILFFPADKLSILTKNHPEWIEYILKLYQTRFEELLDAVNAMAFKKVDERIIDLLNKKSEVLKSNEIETTHEQLANELGTSRVVVSRLLKQLEEEGKVKLGRNKIKLL